MDRLTRTYLLLWAGVVLGAVITVAGVLLVLQAYVPPADILTADGRPVPFFDTVEPLPSSVGILGLILCIGFLVALARGRSRRYW